MVNKADRSADAFETTCRGPGHRNFEMELPRQTPVAMSSALPQSRTAASGVSGGVRQQQWIDAQLGEGPPPFGIVIGVEQQRLVRRS